MLKAVIDTNVFISSFLSKGNPKKVIDLWKTGKTALCLSQGIIDEYIKVLKRFGLRGEEELRDLLKLFAGNRNIIFTAKTPDLQIIEEDPDDNKFIECAVAAEAGFIVSGDKHLLSLKNYCGIQIVNPAKFLEVSNVG